MQSSVLDTFLLSTCCRLIDPFRRLLEIQYDPLRPCQRDITTGITFNCDYQSGDHQAPPPGMQFYGCEH
jgi:hypothetical protein